MVYLHAITLVRTLPCLADPGKLIVIGAPTSFIGEAIPYLANLPGVISYNPTINALTFRRQPGFISIFEDKVQITQVKDVKEGLELLAALTDAINATWDKRHELKPVETARKSPKLLDIWEFLPQTNCKQCGEATCMAFAAGLMQNKRELTECVSLQTDIGFTDRKATLEVMVS